MYFQAIKYREFKVVLRRSYKTERQVVPGILIFISLNLMIDYYHLIVLKTLLHRESIKKMLYELTWHEIFVLSICIVLCFLHESRIVTTCHKFASNFFPSPSSSPSPFPVFVRRRVI